MKRLFSRRARHSSDSRLTVLITNITLAGRSGTEIVTRDLALGLKRHGHHPIVYTRDARGPIADELNRASIPVVTDIMTLTMPIDVIHGHHTPTAVTAICKYPETPAIFVAHDFIAWHDTAPALGSIRKYCAVDTTVAKRFNTYSGHNPSDIFLLLNAVDMKRFRRGPKPAPSPQRALAFAKNIGHLEAIKEACANRNIQLDVVGAAVGNVIDAPEHTLLEYDLVFTSALSALEAMACGRAVIVCDGRGLAGLVTPQTVKDWRPKNFGLDCLTKRLTAENMITEINRYDARMVEKVTDYIRKDADQEKWLDTVENLYRRILEENRAAPAATRFAEIAEYVETWSPGFSAPWPWMHERDALKAELEAAKSGSRIPITGQEIRLSSLYKTPELQLVKGFSHLEEWGVWSNAETAMVLTRRPQGEDHPTSIQFNVQPFVPAQSSPLKIEVMINGLACGNWRFDKDDHCLPRQLNCTLPSDIGGEQLWISFQIDRPRSPRELGMSTDSRKLGIGLTGLTFIA